MVILHISPKFITYLKTGKLHDQFMMMMMKMVFCIRWYN